ncbi:hypothetical protein OAK38_08895 [Verrucomicrobia bacterium]|nr:hypothetical protein [Verrucomicrobiota bacterium]
MNNLCFGSNPFGIGQKITKDSIRPPPCPIIVIMKSNAKSLTNPNSTDSRLRSQLMAAMVSAQFELNEKEVQVLALRNGLSGGTARSVPQVAESLDRSESEILELEREAYRKCLINPMLSILQELAQGGQAADRTEVPENTESPLELARKLCLMVEALGSPRQKQS